jgi:glycosyltransferase involved in cell wall biosynthesis
MLRVRSERKRKTILLVAMAGSVHTARWVNQIIDQGWKIFIYPSNNVEKIHPDISNVSLILSFLERIQVFLNGLGLQYVAKFTGFIKLYLEKKYPGYRAIRLKNAIRKLRPDLVHSLEMQAAGYLTLEVKKQFSGTFPPWLVTSWGSDIFLFGRLQLHKQKIRDVLANCDFYSCECERDVGLARQFDFKGPIMPVFPNTGGFDLASLESERNRVPPSDRKLILLKGYQNWAGRALVGLRALGRCEDILSGYSVVIYSASQDVVIAAELFAYRTGIPVRIIPNNTPHREMLSLHAQARVSIGLSISDAISTSFLEAMVMGSFPIQSCTACADEWIEHGVSGLIVPPEDPELIERAIRTSLADDMLVDQAAEINWHIALTRLDSTLLKQKAVDMYRSILDKCS